MVKLPDLPPQNNKLPDVQTGVKLPDVVVSHVQTGTHYGPVQKLSGFGLSTLESFPELFGIEPTQSTQEFRAANPILGMGSQLVGAFVPYVGAAKALEAVPLAKGIIAGAEALGGESVFARGALKAGTEAGLIEAGRLGISATGLPAVAYEGVTGREPETKPLLDMAGDSLVNVAAGGVLGGAGATLLAKFAKEMPIHDLVSGAAPDQPLLTQIRALNDEVARLQAIPDRPPGVEAQLQRLSKERERRINANLTDRIPQFTTTGELDPSKSTLYKFPDSGKAPVSGQGNPYRQLEGQSKSRPVSGFLNNAANFRNNTVGKATKALRFVFDPLAKDGFSSKAELDDALLRIGISSDPTEARNTLGMYAQDVKVIKVEGGSGKKPLPKDWTPLDFVRNKLGEVKDFYHGTTADINDKWMDIGNRGGISFSEDPRFASIWAENKAGTASDPATGQDVRKGARVYVTAILHDPNKIGDFQNPADVLKAIDAHGLNPNNPDHADFIKELGKGNWGGWENPAMMAKAGWDTVYMVESTHLPGSPKNIFVSNGDRIYSAFDPKVQWAKSQRLLSSPPVWNKPTKSGLSYADQKAARVQKMFTSKPLLDVGDGWRMAKEKGGEGLFLFAKKTVGDPLEAAGGDEWTVFRTDRPDVFAPKAAKMQREVLRSGYFPVVDETKPIGEVAFDTAAAIRKRQDANDATKLVRAKNKIGSAVGEALNTAGTYAAPTVMLGSRNPLLAKGFQFLDEMVSIAEARVNTFMNGTSTYDPKKSIMGEILSFETGHTNGFNDFLKTLTKSDLDTIVNLDEASMDFKGISALHASGKVDIDGNALVSDNVLKFFTAGQALADGTIKRADTLRDVVNDPSIVRVLEAFKSRNAHFAMTREYPGAYRYLLEDEAGNWIGTASGHSPKEAQEVASQVIARQGAAGKVVVRGGMIDDTILSGEDGEKMLAAIRAPGFIKARGKMIGYELSRGDLTVKKLSDLVARNVRRRENLFRDIAIRERSKDIADRLHREAPQDALAFDKRVRIIQGDEGDFARFQNHAMDKALSVFGISGKDSASNIVRGTQKLLGAFTFGFGSMPQVLMNLMGTFQTLMPHVAFALGASPQTLARNFVSLPLLDGANNVKGVFGALSPWKVLKNSMDIMMTSRDKLDPEFVQMFETLAKRGKLAPRFMEEQYGQNAGLLLHPLQAMKEGHSFVEMMGQLNQVLMTKTEELNRGMVVSASYVLGREAGLSGDRLAAFAQEMIAQAAYNYSTLDRATVFTTPLGSLMGTFKNWMFHYMGSMVKYASAGKEGIAPLMWQTASTALIGGAAATPFVNPIANAFSQFYNGNSLMDNMYAAAGNFGLNHRVADGVMYGLPGVMGISLSSQAQAPGSNPERDASMIFSVAALDRVRALSGGVKQALVNATVTGESPWDDPEVRGQLIRGLAPRTIYRAMSIGSDGALKSLGTGNKIMEGLGLGDHLLYTMGFNPVDLDKTYAAYDEIKDNENKKLEAVKALGSTLSDAWTAGDDRVANRTFLRATALGVDASSVLRSAQANQKRETQTGLEFQAGSDNQDLLDSMFDTSQ